MNFIKKFITSVLLASMLLTTAACASDNGGASADTTTADTAETTTAETTEARLPSGIPDTDLDGYEMRFLARFTVDAFNETGVYAEEMNGENINDTVYERNRRIGETYNCVITGTDISENDAFQNAVRTTVTAGDDIYQSVLYGAHHLANFAAQGLLCDLNTLENTDFSQPWWDGKMNDEISVGGKLFFTLGSFMLNAKINLYHIIFNHRVGNDYGISPSDLYESARSGAWTLDEYSSVIKLIRDDLDGDGAYTSKDLWGAGGESYSAYAAAIGAGARFVTKDSNDIPFVSATDPKNITVFTDVLELYADRDHLLVTENITGVDSVWKEIDNMLLGGRLFTMIGSLRSYVRDMEDNYGVLPMPKYSEEQENYYHITTVYNAPVLSVPVTVANTEAASLILEAMAYDFYYDLLPTFYDNFLNTKMLRDTESVEMLQIIHDSVLFELSSLYILSSFVAPYNSTAKSGNTEIASTFESAASSAETVLAGVVESITK